MVNWLADADMLPAVVPTARIFTYDWDANYFRDTPVETLLGPCETMPILELERGACRVGSINRTSEGGRYSQFLYNAKVGSNSIFRRALLNLDGSPYHPEWPPQRRAQRRTQPPSLSY